MADYLDIVDESKTWEAMGVSVEEYPEKFEFLSRLEACRERSRQTRRRLGSAHRNLERCWGAGWQVKFDPDNCLFPEAGSFSEDFARALVRVAAAFRMEGDESVRFESRLAPWFHPAG